MLRFFAPLSSALCEKSMTDNTLEIIPPLYLVGMKIYCWKCQSKMSAVTILAPNVVEMDNQICVLSEIMELPLEVLKYVQSRVPSFKLKYSKTVGYKYYANTCQKCGSLSGDFYLHSEPGAPFFPTDEHEASQLYMTIIPTEKTLSVKTSYHIGTGDLILNNAKQIA